MQHDGRAYRCTGAVVVSYAVASSWSSGSEDRGHDAIGKLCSDCNR
jgi:hypothetical protein